MVLLPVADCRLAFALFIFAVWFFFWWAVLLQVWFCGVASGPPSLLFAHWLPVCHTYLQGAAYSLRPRKAPPTSEKSVAQLAAIAYLKKEGTMKACCDERAGPLLSSSAAMESRGLVLGKEVPGNGHRGVASGSGWCDCYPGWGVCAPGRCPGHFRAERNGAVPANLPLGG